MSVMAATTSHSAPYVHRSYPLATSTGDASYSPAMLERLRRPDGYSRHLPPLSHAHPSEYANTSHGRIRSYVYERAGAPTYPESSSESPSPREARPSLPLPQHSTMQSTSISFATTISATSTWAMPPSAHSPSSTSSSSPVSRARTQQHHRAIESEQGGVVSPKDRDLKLFEAAQRRPLPRALPSLPALRAQAVRSNAHTHHPRERISPDRSRAASPSPLSTYLPAAPPSSTAEQLQRHAYAYRERETERDRQDSWSPESTRQPLPPMWTPQPSRGASPEFVQGSSMSARTRTRGRWAPPPPPSPSPSTSEYSASGRTDTDPTDEDEQEEQVKVEPDQEQVTLPSFRSAFPSAQPMWHSHSHPQPHPQFNWDGAVHLRRDAQSPFESPAAAGSPSSPARASAPVWGPRSAVAVFRHDGALPALVSDIRSLNVSHARSEHPHAHPATFVNTHVNPDATPRKQTQWRIQQAPAPAPNPTSTRARPAPLENFPPVGAALAEIPVISPTPKKYRFVTSKPAEMHRAEEDLDLDERHRPVTVSPSGTKRRYPGASESSIDVPLTPPETPEDEDAPRKRRQAQGQGQQLPFENAFPADSGSGSGSGSGPGSGVGGAEAARFVRSPRGAIVPAYHYDTDRALKCAFPGCGAVLTGKKSETASHMRSHFLQAVGEVLECPWPADSTAEDRNGGAGRGCCGMAFKDSANFGRHVSSKHIRAEEYQCNRCGRPFARRDAALRHMKTLCRTDGAGTRRKNERKVKARTEEYEEVHMFND